MNSRAELTAHARHRRIVLTGFMCAGKTTVARALAARLNCASLDTDAVIVERTGRRIETIFDEDGEARFRQIEHEVLRDCLERGEARIIALGGGAWTLSENRALLAAHDCLTVWLDAPFALCWQRIAAAQEMRPLARNPDHARELFAARRDSYSLAALHIPISGDESAATIAQTIISALEQPTQTQK